jgi:hypothetical protein
MKDPTYHLQAKLLHRTGIHLLHCLCLRVKELDCGQNPIVVKGTRRNEDRLMLLPDQLKIILQEHLRHVNAPNLPIRGYG